MVELDPKERSGEESSKDIEKDPKDEVEEESDEDSN